MTRSGQRYPGAVLPLVDIGHSFSRKILVAFPILLIALLFPLFDSNAQIKLAWDPNPEPDVAGYQIYYGTASRNYGHSIDVGNVTAYALLGLTQGVTYYIALTAYDSSNNESAFSNEVSGRITETVSTPNVLNGPTGGNTGQPCTYTAGGSSSTLGHALQYQFDWKGDGSDHVECQSKGPVYNTHGCGLFLVRFHLRYHQPGYRLLCRDNQPSGVSGCCRWPSLYCTPAV
jgi:hypothetical protein